MISYEPLWRTMKEKGVTKYTLIYKLGFSAYTIANLRIIDYDSESFYATTGDTTDYFYRLAKSMDTDKTLFSTCFEFGTIGDSFFDTILSLKCTMDENRNHWYPTPTRPLKKSCIRTIWSCSIPPKPLGGKRLWQTLLPPPWAY